MATKRIGLTDKHYVAFDATPTIQSTLTAYGKLIKEGESTSSALGISHPQKLDGPLNRSLVYGVQVAGQCIRLPKPEEVALPTPDGRADGCGWDPSEFVVWKNLPRHWTTIHFQSQPKPLITALSIGTSPLTHRLVTASSPATTDIGAQVKGIVETWANMTTEPPGTANLQNLWATSGLSGSFALAAENLAQTLQSQMGSHILGSDITTTMNVNQLIQMV
jgi:hypothetical protein